MAVTVYDYDPGVVQGRVEGILASTLDPEADLNEAMDSALMLITGLAQPAEYTQTEMETLHAWLAAHLFEVDNQRMFEEEIGRAREKPETNIGLGLDLTRPGQQVKVLDYKKAFAVIDPANAGLRKARMFWAGNPRSSFP